jgi:hypothetical protein
MPDHLLFKQQFFMNKYPSKCEHDIHNEQRKICSLFVVWIYAYSSSSDEDDESMGGLNGFVSLSCNDNK